MSVPARSAGLSETYPPLGRGARRPRAAGWRLPERVQLVCVLYISVWALSPPMVAGLIYRYGAIGATAVWLSIELLRRSSALLRPSLPTLCAMVYIVYSNGIGYAVHGTEDLVRNIEVDIFLLFLVVHESYRRRGIEQLRPVFWAVLIVLPVWLGTTISSFGAMHNASRLVIRSSDISEELLMQGVGGYALVYAALVASPILLYLTKVGRPPALLCRLIVLLDLVLSFLLIWRAGYSIAIVLMVVGLVIALLVGARKPAFASTRFLAAILGLFLLVLSLPSLLDLAGRSTEGTMYERKYDDVVMSLANEQSVGTVALRTERWGRSLRLFCDSPLIGTLAFDDVGKHSAILDRFARYGLFFGLVFAYVVCFLPVRYLRARSHNAFGLALAVACVSIPFALVNNIGGAFGCMLFVFYPVAMSYVTPTPTASPFAARGADAGARGWR